MAVPNDNVTFSVRIGCEFKQIVIASPITKSRPLQAFGTICVSSNREYPIVAKSVACTKVGIKSYESALVKPSIGIVTSFAKV